MSKHGKEKRSWAPPPEIDISDDAQMKKLSKHLNVVREDIDAAVRQCGPNYKAVALACGRGEVLIEH